MSLGRRTGQERPPFDPINQRERIEQRRPTTASTEDNVVPLSRGREAVRPPAKNSVLSKIVPGSPLALGLESIREQDPGFDPDMFIEGAKSAHEMIARAFAEGDREAVRRRKDGSDRRWIRVHDDDVYRCRGRGDAAVVRGDRAECVVALH